MIIRLANHFSKHFDVYLLVVCAEGVLESMVSSQVKVISLKGTRTRNMFFVLRREILHVKPDVVFSSISRLNILLLLIKLSIKKPPRLILREVNTPSSALKAMKYGSIYKFLYKLLYPMADKVVCQSKHMLEQMQSVIGLSETQLIHIYNPVNEKYLQKVSHIDKSPFVEGKIDFLAVGRFEAQKGFDILLDAFANIATINPSIHLNIVGDGPLRDDLEKQILSLGLTDRVSLLGYQSDISSFLYHAKAVVSSSRYEGLPNILIESVTVGTPVIATNCPGGTAEIVVEGVNGEMSAEINASSLEQVWTQFIREDKYNNREQISATALKFSPESIYKEYQILFS